MPILPHPPTLLTSTVRLTDWVQGLPIAHRLEVGLLPGEAKPETVLCPQVGGADVEGDVGGEVGGADRVAVAVLEVAVALGPRVAGLEVGVLNVHPGLLVLGSWI